MVLKAARAPSKTELIAAIESAGSADESFFGYPVKQNGLWLQQDPEEFADFVHFMVTRAPPCTLGLDIGIASGGQTKFLRDYYHIPRSIVVDIGMHPDFPHWERIKSHVKTEFVIEITGDSHSETVRQKLLPYAGQIDFAFVDGDHSYFGLRKDIFLVKELLKVGSYMALHDTQAAGDCAKVFRELTHSPDFTLMRNFTNRFGISVWRLNRVKSAPHWFNRRTGLGRI